jgi:gliding motility-associated-like protein
MLKLLRNIIQVFVVVVFLCLSSSLFGQLSKVHYIPPISITSYVSNSFPEDQFIYISTPSVDDITYVIKPIGVAAADYIYGTVSNNSPATFDVRDSNRVPAFSSQIVIPENLGATILKNKGYIIEAEKPIYVSVRLQSQAQAGAIVSKGSAALSNSFLFGGFVNDVNPIIEEYNSFFSVMAVDDDTDITISFPKSVKLHNYAGTYPVTFKLQKNESYVGVLRASEDTNNADGLIGGSLVSSKGVVVISGSSTGTNGEGNGHDYGIDQLVGTEKAGEEFIFIRGEAPNFYNGTENVVLVPLNAGTTYSVNGGAASSITGAYAVIEGDSFNSNKNMYVVTSDPVMAYQGIGGLNPNSGNPEPNQGMFVVPPLSCSAKGGINNIPFINRIGNNSHNGAIGIVAEVGEDVLLNGTVLTNPLSTDNPNYVTYRISNLNQNLYDVNSAGELYVSYYTYSNYASSGGFYSGFQSAPEFDFDLSLVALGTCIQNSLVLNATNLSALDSYRWWYNPSQGAEITQWQEITTNANLSSITPTQVGWYQLRGVYSCGSNTENLNSQEIFIGNCPDDTDNDGVVDNLDLDEDNDGVLDRFESGGDIIPDFTDPNNPLLPSTTDKNISLPSAYGVSASLNTDTNGVLSGDNLGNITSQLNASSGAVNSYELNFTEPTTVSIVFPQNPNYVENEIITVSTTDSNKTISLINTSDELLVDTNYDSAYESGVQYFTNNRVSVKYSPSATTLNNSEFISSSLTNISITHTLENVTKDGELTFQIKIIDHPIDTDGDNISDHSDLDSDKDSCFDVTEAGFEDADKDGVLGSSPVIFDPSSSTSTADIRGRVVFSGYDFNTQPLDNDNNTIYDFQEPSPIPSFSSQPMTTTVTEGDTAQFSVVTTNATFYKWLMNGVAITNDATFNISTDGKTLSISTTDTSLDGKKFSVFINDDTYLCTSSSVEATLNVLALPTAPVLEKLYAFCDMGDVGDLKALIGQTDINIYQNETGGGPLNNNVLLINGANYYVSAFNSLGDESLLRSKTNVLISSPVIVADNNAVCMGESIVLTVNGVPQTVSEFEADNPKLTRFLEYSGSAYFYDPNVQNWNDAYAFISSLGPGATMYQINTIAEHDAVWDALVANNYNLSGRFWLGLKQYPGLKGNPEAVDKGWRWLDGRNLDPTWDLWYDNPSTSYQEEPNDSPPLCGQGCSENSDEDYGQFNYSNGMGKFFNDIGQNNGNSRAVVEFSGLSGVNWYKQEVGGAKTQITGMTSNSIVETPPVTTTYFYETTVNGVVCEDSITITVNDLPLLIPAKDITECDNNLDGDSTDVNEAEFDLMQQRKDMLLSVADRNIFFYETNTANVADSIATATMYTNKANPQTLHYRVLNSNTGCISNTFGSFKLIVDDLPLEISIADLHDCDDDTVGNDKDGKHTFDLTTKTNEILTALGGTGKAFAISYHKTLADAKDNIGGITSYTTQTTDSGEKEIFVRIKDPDTGCVRYDNSFKVIVDKLPTALISTMEVEQCETDGQIKYNLNSLVDHFSSNYAKETFAFYVDAALTTSVVDAENFVVPAGVSTQDVYIKIRDKSTLCERSDDVFTAGGSREPIRVTFTVGKNNVPTTFSPLTFYDCVDESSGIPITGTFDPSIFNEIRAKLLAANPHYNLPNVEISFYKSELDAVFQRDVIDVTQPLIVNPPLKTQEIWVGIQDVGVKIKCLGRIKVADLILVPYPTFDLPATQVFCINLGVDTVIITNQGGTYTYAWTLDGSPFAQTSASITITSGGTYEVTATNTSTGCETSKTIVVDESEFPLFDRDDLTVFDLTGDGSNRIEVLTGIGALGIGDYEFSLDGGPYQDTPIFEDVPPGIHQVSVRDKNGCGTKSIDVSVIGYPLYFTPNGNGKDDYWQVLGVNAVFQSQSLIYIFDRHGRLLAQIPTDGPGWDGTYNGTPMPADDYWFRVKLEDGRTFTGHFSLMR